MDWRKEIELARASHIAARSPGFKAGQKHKPETIEKLKIAQKKRREKAKSP